MRPRHPNKEIESAIRSAESAGWKVVKAGKSAHAWGRLLCEEESRQGCQISIWSTPRSPDNHAKQILRAVVRCPHSGEKNEEL